MDRWDLALLVVAGYFSVVALVRLMVRRRDQLLDDFQRQMETQRGRKKRQPPPDAERRSRAA